MKSIGLVILIFITNIALADNWPVTPDSDIALAKRYNALLNEGNIKEAQKLVSPQVSFSDPTWGTFNRDKAHLIAAFDPKMFAGYHNMAYRIRNVFSSKGTVVIQMIASADVQPHGVTDPVERVHIVIDLIRVIEIKDKLIVRQIDLADYDRALPAILSGNRK